MNFIARLQRKVAWLYRLYIARDPFTVEVARWFKDRGDDTLRLSYPLDASSVVFDVGAYRGDFAAAIHERYGCRVYLFEPVPSFYAACVERCRGNPALTCCPWGLSSADGVFDISVADDGSSFHSPGHGSTVQATVKSVTGAIAELGIETVDLLKLNVEGGEFDILPALIDAGAIERVKYVQVQFHNFIENAAERRAAIRAALARTHVEMWNYEFVWESWRRRDVPAQA